MHDSLVVCLCILLDVHLGGGAQVYFNTYCGTALLYEVERQQFKDFKEEFPDIDLTEA